jgi:hypothetical protein
VQALIPRTELRTVLARNLRRHLIAARLDATRLADLAGVSRTQMHAHLCGAASPQMRSLDAFAVVLEVPPWSILREEPALPDAVGGKCAGGGAPSHLLFRRSVRLWLSRTPAPRTHHLASSRHGSVATFYRLAHAGPCTRLDRVADLAAAIGCKPWLIISPHDGAG